LINVVEVNIIRFNFYTVTNYLWFSLVTSLLQQAAVSYSAEGKHVVYIRPESLSSLPAPVHGMYQMNYATVQNIKYL